MILRPYLEEDCKEIARMFYDTVHSVNARDYTKDQLNVWATGTVDLGAWNKSFLEHITLVAIENECIVGFGDISATGYLDRLYVHKDYQAKGVASAILDELIQQVEADKIETHASITARPFFEGKGFRVIKEQQVERKQIFLTNFVMERKRMTEREKMLAGELYDCGDKALIEQWHKAKNLMRDYNQTNSEDAEKKSEILHKLLGGQGSNLWITAPFYVDYGENIFFGNNCEVNMNCTFLDDNKIIIGNQALIAPNVQIYTAYHPTNFRDRFGEEKEDGSFPFCLTRTAPVVIGNNVWIGGGVIIMPGVTIGDNVVIGAGSVVTKDIPSNKIAYGNPCKVIRDNC